jgi:hypothetical protein
MKQINGKFPKCASKVVKKSCSGHEFMKVGYVKKCSTKQLLLIDKNVKSFNLTKRRKNQFDVDLLNLDIIYKRYRDYFSLKCEVVTSSKIRF